MRRFTDSVQPFPVAKQLTLELDGSPVEFSVRRILVAGYTGRDREQVRAHVAELERQGIASPGRPCLG